MKFVHWSDALQELLVRWAVGEGMVRHGAQKEHGCRLASLIGAHGACTGAGCLLAERGQALSLHVAGPSRTWACWLGYHLEPEFGPA